MKVARKDPETLLVSMTKAVWPLQSVATYSQSPLHYPSLLDPSIIPGLRKIVMKKPNKEYLVKQPVGQFVHICHVCVQKAAQGWGGNPNIIYVTSPSKMEEMRMHLCGLIG